MSLEGISPCNCDIQFQFKGVTVFNFHIDKFSLVINIPPQYTLSTVCNIRFDQYDSKLSIELAYESFS